MQQKNFFHEELNIAMRHAKYMRFLKKIFFILICFLLFSFFSFMSNKEKDKIFPIKYEGENIILSKTSLESYKNEKISYKISAQTIEQDNLTSDNKFLKNVNGTIGQKKKFIFNVKKATYQQRQNLFLFETPFIMKGENGERVFIEKGSINLKNKEITGNNFIHIQNEKINLKAKKLSAIFDKKIIFSNDVILSLPAF